MAHPQEPKIRAFGQLVIRMQHGGHLTREETHAAYLQIWRNEQPELQQGALIAVHKMKGPTVDEITGIVESHNDEWGRVFPHVVEAPEPHLGLIGVGMDSLKTINVSSGAAVIAAACGVYVHKVGGPGMTGVSGSHDVFTLWGVDVNGDPADAVRATERCRLGFTSPLSQKLHHSGIFRVLSQLRIMTAIHASGPLGFHSGERRKIVGVPRPDMVRPTCEILRNLGYTHALVPCGGASDREGHLDELSNLGPTLVGEVHPDGSISEYTLTPADGGLAEARFEDVASAKTREENAALVARILAGRIEGPMLDLLAFNAASALKLMGKVDHLRDGVDLAKTAVAEGRALAQLRSTVETQNRDPKPGLAALDALLAG